MFQFVGIWQEVRDWRGSHVVKHMVREAPLCQANDVFNFKRYDGVGLKSVRVSLRDFSAVSQGTDRSVESRSFGKQPSRWTSGRP